MKLVIAFILISLFLIKPSNKRKNSFKPYEDTFIAHRGLFNNIDIPENSISAFKKAINYNYGIELDVQLTSDNILVVFHDESLLRMTGKDLTLRNCSYKQIKNIKLLNTNETIPKFEDVLKVLKPSAPLIIEIKPEGKYIETTKTVIEIMKDYKGIYNVESFNPLVVRYLRKNEPQIIRGQLSYNYCNDNKSKLSKFMKFVLTNLLLNFYTKPDYIAYDCTNISNPSFKLISKVFHGECVAWTVKSQKEYEQIKEYYDVIIFDSCILKK